MAKKEYEVTLRYGGVHTKGTTKVPFIEARTKVAGKTVFGRGLDENQAMAALEEAIAGAEAIVALRAEYPKTVLVTL